MVKLIVDEALGRELNSVQGPVALCDPSGRVLGHFVPLSTLREQQQAMDECPYTEAELERLERQTGGRTLAEIWKSLGRA
ncbi:MAG: hypothetical protein WD847_14770 [Pirellulales bacterium]